MKVSRLRIYLLPLVSIVASVVLIGCDGAVRSPLSVSSGQNIRFIAAYPLEIPEPSGLSLSKDHQNLWLVSDADGMIYQTTLEGRVLSAFQSGHGDLEGIATMGIDKVAFIAERERKILVARKVRCIN